MKDRKNSKEANAPSSIKYLGFVDYIGSAQVKGWVAAQPIQPNPIRVGLLVRGILVDSTIASIYRDDLAKANIQDGKVGFALSFPYAVKTQCKNDSEVVVLGKDDKSLFLIPRYQKDQGGFLRDTDYSTSDLRALCESPDIGENQQPIFVIGPARSGTTAIFRAIVNCTGIVAYDEGQFLPIAKDLLSTISFYYKKHEERLRENTMLANVAEEYWRDALANLLRRTYRIKFGDRNWGDKTPTSEMIELVPYLHYCWPQARFIFCRRRGIENLNSRLRKFPETPFSLLVNDWKRGMEAWEKAREHLDGRYIEIEQLEMVRSPEAVSIALGDFLGLSKEAAGQIERWLRDERPEQTKDAGEALSLDEVSWSEENKQIFISECGPLMRDYGYSFDKNYYASNLIESTEATSQTRKDLFARHSKSDVKYKTSFDALLPLISRKIDPADDIYAFIAKHPSLKEDPSRAYFESGFAVIDVMKALLESVGRPLSSFKSILEFACGHGRVTRFLVKLVPAERITISDVVRQAVDFGKREFGVRGFYSTYLPEYCPIPAKYELIIVASLFSHLPVRTWRQWLALLYDSLEPSGLLIFSTHGPHCLPSGTTMPEPGFMFLPNSESSVLPEEQYGSTYVTQRYVVEECKTISGREPMRTIERGLWNFQDLYVLKRPIEKP